MKEYKITILPVERTITVQAGTSEIDDHGLPGSLLSIINLPLPDLIPHACGGVSACSTCHVYVQQGLDSCSEISSREEDRLDAAPLVRPNSRLACCCIPSGEEDIVIELPAWTKNEMDNK